MPTRDWRVAVLHTLNERCHVFPFWAELWMRLDLQRHKFLPAKGTGLPVGGSLSDGHL